METTITLTTEQIKYLLYIYDCVSDEDDNFYDEETGTVFSYQYEARVENTLQEWLDSHMQY